MRKLKQLFLVILLCATHSLWAQHVITGKVTDKEGNPLPGVTVTIKNTKTATTTGPDGNFKLIAPSSAVLVFSSVGFQPQESPAGAASVSIALQPTSNTMSEVLVVGYGTKTRRDVTGSISKVSAKDITNTPATSFETAIQGRASGVFVSQQNGKVGQGINIRIRGASSVSAGNEPLYVIDGIPVISTDLSSNGASTDPMADINMNDIESIDILKDASAAAIYGSRASNGVVLITTKKGRAGTSKIDFSYFTGLQYPTNKRQFLNAKQYVDFFERAAVGAAKQDVINGYEPDLATAIADEKAYVESRFTRYAAGDTTWKNGSVNTNWQDQVYQRAPISQYDLNFSGGNDKTRFYASGQYLDQNGIIIKNNYKRYSGRLNLEHQVKDWLSIGANMSYSRSENDRVSNDDQFSTPLQIVALSPITPLIDPRTGLLSGSLDLNTGNPNTNFPVYYNPLLSVDNAYYHTKVNRTLGNVFGNVSILKGLSFRTELGLDQLNQTEDAYRGRLTARNEGVPNGYGYYISKQILNVNTNNYFHYNTTFNTINNLDLTGGMSYEKTTNEGSEADAQDFPSDSYKLLSSGAKKIQATTSETENSLLSYFLRANYKYNDKYLLAVSGRYDGSSRFGANHKYGFFPAASAGWIISKEDFMPQTTWLSFLKVKASYGLTGNQNIDDFPSLALYTGNSPYGGQPGQTPLQLGNPNLKWESTVGTDAGLEAGLFNNRISVEFDVYQRLTRDLLLNMDVPGTSGFAYQFRNVGSLSNKGIEITINTTNIATKSVRWTSNLNFSANKNRITYLGGQILGGSINKAIEGQPLGVFYGREYAGVDPQNGDALYFKNTKKADGTLDRGTTNDYNAATDVPLGSPQPKFIYGFDNTVTYKAFDLDILLQGVYGNKLFNGGGQYMSAEGSNGFDNQTIDQLRAWQKPGDITDVPEPRLFYANGTDNSSRYLSDGSYLRVKSVSLGYNLPASLIRKARLERVRIYFRTMNLFTITKYKGWDPEVNADYQASNINQGVDFYSAPQIKSFVLGVNIGL